jgi:hypothetical protein
MTKPPRLQSLKRLVALYGAVEVLHSTELQRITAAVREAQQSVSREQTIEMSARKDGHAALCSSDRIGWKMADTQQEAAASRRDLFEQMRRDRIVLRDAAMEQYVASRLKREQIKRLQDDIVRGIAAEQSRHVQAASDDRFLARRRWTDARDKRTFRE